MQTNFKNLDWFEVVTVCMILVGLILLGALIFGSLSAQKQKQISSAMSIFDLHGQIGQEAEIIKLVTLDLPQSYMNEFYLAFEQTMSVDKAYGAATTFISSVRPEIPRQAARPGKVLGISLEDSKAEIPYSFVPPKRILLFNVISP